jgi:molecular chaperone GrpE (heat shock protein)
MSDHPLPVIPKWPFLCADIVLACGAAFVIVLSAHPIGMGPLVLCVLCLLCGACLGVLPYLLEYRSSEHAFQSDKLQSATDQLHNLELLNVQVGTSLTQLHVVLEECAKLVSTSGSLSDQITAEAKAFKENSDKAHEAEKSSLRLEIEKFRRSETEWLQVLTGIMDHVYALHQAAVRSGQPELARQIGLFQRACRDLARRIGLVPFAPEEQQPFDPNMHHVADAEAPSAPGTPIARIMATGYTYQGQLIRRALVSFGSKTSTPAPTDAPTTTSSVTDSSPMAPSNEESLVQTSEAAEPPPTPTTDGDTSNENPSGKSQESFLL